MARYTGSTSVRSVGIFHVENTARRYVFDDIQADHQAVLLAQLADLPCYAIPIQFTIDPFRAIFLNESVHSSLHFC